MHTVVKGDISVAMLIATFLANRFVVLKPVSENSRYDLVIDRGAGFERVQCKTGRIRNGVIQFHASSSMAHWGKGRKSYRGQIELFGVYCPCNDECYLVPVHDVGKMEGYLRIDPAKNNQSARITYADNYLLSRKTPDQTATIPQNNDDGVDHIARFVQ